MKSLENIKKADPEVREERKPRFAAVPDEGRVGTAPASRGRHRHSLWPVLLGVLSQHAGQCWAQSRGSGNLRHQSESPRREWDGGEGRPGRATGKSTGLRVSKIPFKPSSATSQSHTFLTGKMRMRTNLCGLS